LAGKIDHQQPFLTAFLGVAASQFPLDWWLQSECARRQLAGDHTVCQPTKGVNMKTVILIDDNEDDLFFTQLVFERLEQDCELIQFQSAPQALAQLSLGNLPSGALVLLDINMPVMNGFDFLQAYEDLPVAQRVHLVVVMLTSSYDEKDKERAFQFPSVKDFVNKPIDAAQASRLLELFDA
jgi:CheY-like chemotaxis protein